MVLQSPNEESHFCSGDTNVVGSDVHHHHHHTCINCLGFFFPLRGFFYQVLLLFFFSRGETSPQIQASNVKYLSTSIHLKTNTTSECRQRLLVLLLLTSPPATALRQPRDWHQVKTVPNAPTVPKCGALALHWAPRLVK